MLLYYYAIIGAALALTDFKSTINLGAVLIGILVVIGFGWASRKDKRSERWEKLYDLASTERKELQEALDEAKALIVIQTETIAKLDALQMPVKIIELMNTSVDKIDHAAQGRLENALVKVKQEFLTHETRAQERHDSQMELWQEMLQYLAKLSQST